jgi:class 3 adenylate cyclase/tetratricopeptide (TPR) repeat protein
MDASSESQTRVSRYLPRPVIGWLADEPDRRVREVEGSLVFADVSGFTALSERLAKQGRVGAEILADTISSCFARLLAAAYGNGGSLLKFGGDALLLFFSGDDHCHRACQAAFGMRRELRALGPIDGSNGRTRLRMSVGVHTGTVHLFLVGDQHRELIVTGPAATEVVRMEAAADKGEIVVSRAVAAAVAPSCLGAAKDDGFLLRRAPGTALRPIEEVVPAVDAGTLNRALPAWLRQHALSQQDDPQHRTATVAFVKFQGTDELLRSAGAAAAAAALESLLVTVQQAVEQHDVFLLGTDVDKDGGKLIVVGGAPAATGHDEQSVLCVAREIVESDQRLAVRVGVHAGSAFAGDIGPAYRRTFTVMGDTVNLAARVMAHAEPGSVLATRAVLERCRAAFALTPVEPFAVKGKTVQVEASVVGPAAERRAEPLTNARPMIGREAELDTLRSAWQSAADGHGCATVLVGEPGIGKSRLMAELLSSVDAATHSVACEQYAANTPYAVVRQLLRQVLGCVQDSDRVLIRRLEQVLSDADDDLRQFAPLLGLVLRVDLPMTRAVAELDERFRRDRLEQTVLDLLRLLLPGPTMIAVEDAHWMDEASAHLVARLLDELSRTSWLVCLTRRPVPRGLVPQGGITVHVLELEPLHSNAATALAEILATEYEQLAPSLVADVVAKAGGNPLFLAELMAGLTASGAAELPDSLEGLILARIDALEPDDAALLRRLSVLGATFSYDLASAVLGDRLPSVDDGTWSRLSEFLEMHRSKQLGFKHALLMDGAYNSLPFRVRESLHAAVGTTIERQAGDADEDQAEVLSLHFFHAKRYPQAWRYSRIAAERAHTVYANVEAARFYERAVDAARRAGCASPEELLGVYEALGNTCRRMGELPRAATAYRAARQCALGDAVAQSRLLLKQAGVRQQEGSFPQALRWLGRADQVLVKGSAVALGQQRGRVAVARASVAKDQDRPREIVRWCQVALTEAERAGDRETQAHAAFLLDHGYVRLGRAELAQNSSRALALYEELGDLWGQGSVLNNLGARAYWAGRWEEAVDLYERGRRAFERIGDVGSTAMGMANVGEIRSDQGRVEAAAELFQRCLQIWKRMGDRASVAFVMSNMGRLATRTEMFEEAQKMLHVARDLAQSLGMPADVLEADLRLLECLCHSGDAAAAWELAESIEPRVPAHSIQAAMFSRLRGLAALQLGRLTDARAQLEVSLIEARAAEAPYEAGMTLRALAYHDVATDVDPMPHLTEAEAVLTRLGVVAVDEPVTLSLTTRSEPAIPAQAGSGRRQRSVPS